MTTLDLYIASRRSRISANYSRDTHAVLRAAQAAVGVLEDAEAYSIQDWLGALKIKPASVVAYAFTLRQFYTFCIAKGLRQDNPALELELPVCRKPFRKNFVSAQTVRMLIDGCRDMELRYCLYCGFHAGLRFSEVVASRPNWYSVPNRTLSVLRSSDYDTKDHTDRDIPLTDQFFDFLGVYGFPSPYMIAPQKALGGAHRYRFDFSNRFENYVRSRNVAMTFHDCRRTFASLHVQAGTSVYKVSRWLGDDVDVVSKHYGFLSSSDPEINRAFAA